MTQAYPLQWPAGRPRTQVRQGARFSSKRERVYQAPVSIATACERLFAELEMLGLRTWVLSTNGRLTRSGQPESGKEPQDPGAAVYFQLGNKPMALSCDRWSRLADNIVAIAKHIEAMRGMERWGVGTAAQMFAGFEMLPAPGRHWRDVLELHGPADAALIDARFRRLAKERHPDAPGGSTEAFLELSDARDAAFKELAK